MQLTLKADSRPAAAVVLRESENRGMNRLTLLDTGETPRGKSVPLLAKLLALLMTHKKPNPWSKVARQHP